MLAYAAPKTAGRDRSPKALMLILAGHAAVIAAVLAAKPEIIDRVLPRRTTIINIPVPPPPKPVPQAEQPRQPVTQPSFIDQERPIVEMEQQSPIQLASGPSFEDIGTVIGSGPTTVIDPPRHVPVRIGARFATSESALKPPYPLDKIRSEEEATLRLKLTIDARGRVTAVDPVGAADPSFLEAARRHIVRAWRYKPAMEDGVAVPTTTVISLSFRLEDV
jgi:periplasmic protein TonB